MSFDSFRKSLTLLKSRHNSITDEKYNVTISEDTAAIIIQKYWRRWKILKVFKESYDYRIDYRDNIIKYSFVGSVHFSETLKYDTNLNKYFYKNARKDMLLYSKILYYDEYPDRESDIFYIFCRIADTYYRGELKIKEIQFLVIKLLRLFITEGGCLLEFIDIFKIKKSDQLSYHCIYDWYISHKRKYKYVKPKVYYIYLVLFMALSIKESCFIKIFI